MGMDGELLNEPVMNPYEQKRLECLTEEFYSFTEAWYKAKRGKIMGSGFNKANDDDMWFVDHYESLPKRGIVPSEENHNPRKFKSPKPTRKSFNDGPPPGGVVDHWCKGKGLGEI